MAIEWSHIKGSNMKVAHMVMDNIWFPMLMFLPGISTWLTMITLQHTKISMENEPFLDVPNNKCNFP